jgi:hypothetical protein
MTVLSIHGLDDQAIAVLKQRAARENATVDMLVVRLIEQGLGLRPNGSLPKRHHDLDALAGSWTADDMQAFDRATAPFSSVDSGLWQ